MTWSLIDLAGRFRLVRHASDYAGDCPACGYANAFSAGFGRDGRILMHCFNGCSWTVLHDAARGAFGSGCMPPPQPDGALKQANQKARKQLFAQRLWQASRPCPASPAQMYLARRGIEHVATTDALRFHPNCPYLSPSSLRFPTLVSAVRDVAGTLLAIQRTYLTPNGRKADVHRPRASLGPIGGGAVQLDPAGPELVVGEGVESSASAGLLLGLPAWAALSAGNLMHLLLPPCVSRVVIAVDHDHNGIGQRAAEAAAQRWLKEGRTVRLVTPDRAGTDFNDLVQPRTTGVADG